ISTDHAPHSAQEKKQNAPGFIGIETAFSTCYEVLVKSGLISLNDLVRIMSTRPSEILRIKKGKLEPGYLADFTLVDLDKSFVYKEEDILSKSKNSLMIGKTLTGSVERVYRKGVLKYENNR
ncbi:amidohydrolase family protein, partial [uncultured Anaerococcus sp.]